MPATHPRTPAGLPAPARAADRAAIVASGDPARSGSALWAAVTPARRMPRTGTPAPSGGGRLRLAGGGFPLPAAAPRRAALFA
ncbi:MAG: hypothetical protein QOE27_1423, partial [Solirubrobacteraceae bacterium]|nr:hypothetical protein [Solirubrobacteraceae bacterium]